ncbi:hypothetical protein [Azospirillum argentinense]
MTTIPPNPSLPPIVMQELRRECVKAALGSEWPNNPIAVMNLATVYEGFALFGDQEIAWRRAGFGEVADSIAAARSAGRPVETSASLPANVATLRPKG